MHKSGQTVELRAGDYEAIIVTTGAGLAQLKRNGRHLTLPHRPEDMPPAHLGKVLIPWPNRIANGSYTFDNETLHPAINDSASGAAIHGLLAWHNWHIARKRSNEVMLTAFLPPNYGYPFMLRAEVTWTLDSIAGLQARICATNIGDTDAPYGAGAHPYLTCNLQKIDSCELLIPRSQLFDPVRRQYASIKNSDMDFTIQRIIDGTRIDHSFNVIKDKEPWEVRLTSSLQGMSVWLRSTQPWVQIYSGEKLDRKGLAVEPMSCPPDAFNSKIDLIRLKPGETHHLLFSIGGDEL
ncbi:MULTISPECIES: aldose-1-epimerase [Klebsiella pneumoniae complex]|uniref:aldose-1-epimerase n=1 Tax=Klebsiella pneumoniae complex TaxID=3390273 RepID=UPI00049F5EAB|nr:MULTISPECIES: aldose-1-epimerase [Klebsiella]KDL58482.1 hypothetical protein AD94_03076 [Klebsiella variicola]QNC78343.1 aldose-1-epimerase [Klebsiella quasipneumoniae]HDK6209649.1 aldose-1-epimerase [Klebsiella quasipneumoniae]